MNSRRRRSITKPTMYFIGFLALVGWMFGDDSGKEPTRNSPQPTEQISKVSRVEPKAKQPEVTASQEIARPENEPLTTVDQTWVYVIGSRVNIRDQPNVSGKRIGAYSQPTHLVYLQTRGDWVAVKHPTELIQGWMHGDYLSFTAPKPRLAEKPALKKKQIIRKAARTTQPAQLSSSQIRQQIVDRSIGRYAGSCCAFHLSNRTITQRAFHSDDEGHQPWDAARQCPALLKRVDRRAYLSLTTGAFETLGSSPDSSPKFGEGGAH